MKINRFGKFAFMMIIFICICAVAAFFAITKNNRTNAFADIAPYNPTVACSDTESALDDADGDYSSEKNSSEIWYKERYDSCNDFVDYYDYSDLKTKITSIMPSERNKILSLPEHLLANMSTEGLLITCLDYPLFGDILFYDTYLMGFDVIVRNYNGLHELLSREDIGAVVLDYYKKVDYAQVLATDIYGGTRLKFLELIISSDDVLQTMTYDMRKELLKICIEKYKLLVDEYEGQINPIATAFVAGRVLAMDCPKFKKLAESEPMIQNFLQRMEVGECSDELWNKVVQCVREDIK